MACIKNAHQCNENFCLLKLYNCPLSLAKDHNKMAFGDLLLKKWPKIYV